MKLNVGRLGHHGDGIAEGPVYVPMTLPGEVVEAEVTGDRATDVSIVTPSPDRVRPVCRHYKACGGCAVQHASDPFVAAWKAGQVRAALAAQGIDLPDMPVQTSPPASRRRATLSGRRTKTGAIVGFHGRASGVLTEIPDCRLLRPELIAALPSLAEITRLAASRKAELSLAVTLTETGIDLAIDNAKPFDPVQHSGPLTAAGDFARITWNGETVAEARVPMVRLGPALVPLPPGGFLQATEHGQAALTQAVLDNIGPARRVIDLFSGLGTFTLPLARTAEVHAVESDAAMLAALDQGWRNAQGLHRVTTERRDLFRRPLEADELKSYDAAVIDPPRAGAEAQTERLAQAGIPIIAAVSCNPQTFARDARILTDAGYLIDRVTVVDQFRWSTHVELAARFSKGDM